MCSVPRLASYIIVSVAAPIYLHRRGELRPRHVIAQIDAIAFMAIALAGAVYPLPNAPALYSIYAIIILMARCASESNLTRRQSARGFPTRAIDPAGDCGLMDPLVRLGGYSQSRAATIHGAGREKMTSLEWF